MNLSATWFSRMQGSQKLQQGNMYNCIMHSCEYSNFDNKITAWCDIKTILKVHKWSSISRGTLGRVAFCKVNLICVQFYKFFPSIYETFLIYSLFWVDQLRTVFSWFFFNVALWFNEIIPAQWNWTFSLAKMSASNSKFYLTSQDRWLISTDVTASVDFHLLCTPPARVTLSLLTT